MVLDSSNSETGPEQQSGEKSLVNLALPELVSMTFNPAILYMEEIHA